MDIDNCYHLAQDIQLYIVYDEQRNAYTASILEEGRDIETLVKQDSSVNDTNYWFETIEVFYLRLI